MNPDREELVANYAAMGETELMDLARSYDTLTDPAQTTLRAEFARRGLEPPLIEDGDGVPEQRNLVTIRRYNELVEADIARSVLESAGIPVYLRDENMARIRWGISIAMGGIRLQVDATNAVNAAELLDQPMPPTIRYDALDDFAQPDCPTCGSGDISSSRFFGVGEPVPPGSDVWRCGACGECWEQTEV
jgi:Putative prokaryotic signal transducing protein